MVEVQNQTWWEGQFKVHMLEGDPWVTMWEVFKTLIKYQFYTIEYEDNHWICIHYIQ